VRKPFPPVGIAKAPLHVSTRGRGQPVCLPAGFKHAGITPAPAHVTDGRAALAYLAGEGVYADRTAHPLPNVIFLDLNLPYLTGLQVLEWIRLRPEFARIVVIILTSSNEISDLRRAYELGANSYVVKPSSANDLLQIATTFRGWWLETNRFHTLTRG
jgi:CheY-like chemotaxis protein